jgi:hypothetical protein
MLSDLLGLVVVCALALIPGLGLSVGLARRLKFSIAKTLPFSFAVSAAFAGLLSLFGVGLRLDAAIWLFFGAIALSWVAGYFIGRGQERLRVGEPALWLAAVVTVVTMIERPWYGRSVDTFYHLAAIRSLLTTGQAIPTDPIYGVANSAPDPTSGALHTLVAMWSSLSHVDPEILWVGVTALGAALTVLAFWALARRVSGSDRAATWAAIGYYLFVMYADGRAFGYPNRLSYALVFASMTALVELAERGSLPAAAFSAIALFAAGAVHLGSALLAIVFALLLVGAKICYAVFQHFVHKKAELRPLLWVGGTVGVSLALMLPLIALRAAPVAAANLQVSAIYPVRFTPIVGPVGIVLPPPEAGGWILFSVSAALVALMMGYAFIRRDRVTLAAATVAGIPLFVIFNPLVASLAVAFSPYTIARLDALLAFTPWIAVAWGLSKLRRDVPPQVRLLTWSVIILAVLIGQAYLRSVGTPWPVATRRGETTWVGQSFFNNLRRDLTAPGIEATRAIIGTSNPVIAGDPFTVYALIGSVPARAVAVPRSHSQFSVESVDGEQRRQDMTALLDPTAAASDRRVILQHWDAHYVALDLTDPPQARAFVSIVAQPQEFELLVQDREFVLFKVLNPG